MSYKFQRLREKIRQAILSGELTGKLPGERTLARRFHANAKTLSKALTDLAAEGLLDRSIGRGTFVKGSEPEIGERGRWLLICDEGGAEAPVVQHIMQANPDSQIVTGPIPMRPSFINQFSAVIDLARATPEAFLRDLVIRNISVVAVGREPQTYSMDAVVIDRAMAASNVARDLLLAGHRRFAVVEERSSSLIYDTLRSVASRLAPDAVIDAGYAGEVGALVEHGVTAIVCDSLISAEAVRNKLDQRGFSVPDTISLAAVGSVNGQCPCSGYFVPVKAEAQAVLELLRRNQTRRPATLWLAGTFIDRGTIGATAPPPQTPLFARPTMSV